jgi:DNA-binding NarL/FixJ family response regulator
MYKIAIVDDEQLIIEGLKMILETDPEIAVVHTAQNGKELFDIISSGTFEAEAILLDLSMPVLDGYDTLLQMQSLNVNTKVIILTSHYNDSLIIKLLDEGASAFLAKNEDPHEVIRTIKNVITRGFHMNDYIAKLIKDRRLLAKTKVIKEALSIRELEVLRLICHEYSTKEIADKLYISPRTVEGHRNRIIEKINCKNIAGMVVYAIEHRIIEVNISKYT